MLTIEDRYGVRLCQGVTRRAVLQAGSLATLGAGLLPGAQPAAWAKRSQSPRVKHCIVLFLMGGPPQHSTWDPKPQAPAEVRGEFKPVATTVPGLQICELLPQLARRAHHLALLRAVVTGDNAHSSSGYYMLTGVPHAPKNMENANPGPPNDWPNLGAVVQHFRGGQSLLPAAVRLPLHIFNTDGSVWPGQTAGWLGHRAEPWYFRCRPADKDYRVPQFRLQADVSLDRLGSRRRLIRQLESQLRRWERHPAVQQFADLRSRGMEILFSPKARQAVDLNREPDSVRDRYGRNQFGQSVLLARRLVEAGVQYVHVNWYRGPDEPPDAPVWDTHARETKRLKTVLCPPLDQAFSALLDDLESRGLLDETLVLCMAEFGRTPRIYRNGGRNHWGHVFSVVMAGGGVQGGAVYGQSDAIGAYPVTGIVRPEDIAATVFHLLGFNPRARVRDPLGREHEISRGQVICPVLS